MHQHFYIMTLSAKISFSVWGLRPKDHYQNNCILPSHPIITVDLSMNVNNWAHPLNHVICFKYLLQICTKMNGFKFDFSKILGKSNEPLPQTPSPFSLGLCPQIGLHSQFMGASHPLLWLRPRLSGASQPRFGLHPQLSISEIGLTPKIYFWIRQYLSAPPLVNSLIGHWLLIINYTDWL